MLGVLEKDETNFRNKFIGPTEKTIACCKKVQRAIIITCLRSLGGWGFVIFRPTSGVSDAFAFLPIYKKFLWPADSKCYFIITIIIIIIIIITIIIIIIIIIIYGLDDFFQHI